MITWFDIVQGVGLLAVPIILGLLIAAVGIVRDVPAASRGLNAYALYVGFPALILVSLMQEGMTPPSTWGFWAAIPITQVLIIGWTALQGRVSGRLEPRGAIALTGLFPNAGYLGLPLCIVLFGDPVAGEASLLVALHVAAGVTVGPWLLGRWSGGGGAAYSVRQLVQQPLVWSPIVGWCGRYLPGAVRDPLLTALQPLAAAAAPVALFLLGLYIWHHRADVHLRDSGLWQLVITRLVVAPALAFGVVAALLSMGALEPRSAVLIALFASLPVAITALVLAAHVGIGTDRIAGGIVVSTVIALLTLPALIRLALVWFSPGGLAL